MIRNSVTILGKTSLALVNTYAASVTALLFLRLLVRDFNMSDQSADYWRIASRHEDAYRSAGWGLGFTFSSLLPHIGWTPALARLDYVFYDESFETLEARVWPHSGGSDHLPVFVTLQWSS